MKPNPIRLGFIVAASILFPVAASCADAAANTNAHVTYVETAKPVEPLDAKSAATLADAFFRKRYGTAYKTYFLAKMEYGWWTKNSPPYTWEVTYYPKPGRGVSLNDLFCATLLVTQDGKVSVGSDSYTTFPAKSH